MARILGGDGQPVPPTDITERLARIHPSYHLRWFRDGGCWALAWTWLANDDRREMVRDGGMSEDDAWDAIAFAPAEVSAEDAYGLLIRGIGNFTREDIRATLNRVHLWNAGAVDRAAAPILDEAMNVAEVKGGKLFGDGAPKVYGPGEKGAPKPAPAKAPEPTKAPAKVVPAKAPTRRKKG